MKNVFKFLAVVMLVGTVASCTTDEIQNDEQQIEVLATTGEVSSTVDNDREN